MKAIKFNTGRQYTAEGQIVIAWVVSEETDDLGTAWCVVRFNDTSRMVSGEIEIAGFTQANIMARYDLCQYKNVWITREEMDAARAATN